MSQNRFLFVDRDGTLNVERAYITRPDQIRLLPGVAVSIAELQRAGFACVVVTTHSFEEAERIADRVVIMAAGRVVADGTLAVVRGGRSLEDVYFALTAGGTP